MKTQHALLVSYLVLIGLSTSPQCLAALKCSGALEAKQSMLAKNGSQLATYLTATLNSLDKMRGQNGFVSDTIWIKAIKGTGYQVKTLNKNTSPTNIALDLLIQTELSRREGERGQSIKKISQVLETLDEVEFHQETGLFFSRYSADSKSSVEDLSVSSIDNIHLALALWTVKENFAGSVNGDKARKIFERMNFSIYYDLSSGLIGGNLIHENGKWTRESYNFANLGSEARILYSLGWALGLFHSQRENPNFLPMATKALSAEILHSPEGDLLKLWDGSAFQLFFPKIFVGEEKYSKRFADMFESYGNYMVAEGQRRNLSTPASHSAGRSAISDQINPFQTSIYKDKAGNLAVVSSDNHDVSDPRLAKDWQSTFTPYALFMAATSNPKLLDELTVLRNLKSGNDRLYVPSMGWMDGYHIEGRMKGLVVPIQISLNQGMLALSLLQMQSSDGLSASGRALYRNEGIRKRLAYAYQMFDARLAAIPAEENEN